MAFTETKHVRSFRPQRLQMHDSQLTWFSFEGVHENGSETLSNKKD